MEIIKMGAVILITVVIVNCLPTFSKEISILISFSCCIVILLYIINMVVPAVEQVRNIAEKISFEGIEVIIKAVGVGFVTQFVSDIVTDSGNKALSNQMIFAGRICVLMMAVPVFLQVFQIIEKLLNQ